jgi:hypothetical protein
MGGRCTNRPARLTAVTGRYEGRALRDVGAAVVWLLAWPLHRILKLADSSAEIVAEARERPIDGLTVYLVNFVRTWAWGVLVVAWTVPGLVVVNLVPGRSVEHVVYSGVGLLLTCAILSGLRAGLGELYGDRAAARRLLTPSSVDLLIAALIAAMVAVA